MDAHRTLAPVSAAQLSLGVAGLVVALRRRHAFDVSFMRGDPERIGRQSIVFGTAFSAPALLLIVQAGAATRLMRGPDVVAARLLRALGAVYVGGYLAERQVRRSLSRRGWDPVESPMVITALALSVAMFCLGERGDPGTWCRRTMVQRWLDAVSRRHIETRIF